MNSKSKDYKHRLTQSAKLGKWGRVRRVAGLTEDRWIMQSLMGTLRDLEEMSSRCEATNYPSILVSLCVSTTGTEGMQSCQSFDSFPNTSFSTLSDDKSNDSNSNFLSVPLNKF